MSMKSKENLRNCIPVAFEFTRCISILVFDVDCAITSSFLGRKN